MAKFPRASRRTLVIGAWALSVVLALAIGWWAALQATHPPVANTPTASEATIEVGQGTLSVEQAYGINVDWPTHPVGVNGASGTLTSINVSGSGSQVGNGDVLYTVDLSPVVAVEGAVPAFRDLAAGMSGTDVLQLEKFLNAKGYLTGNVDGVFGSATSAAVSNWTKDLGQPPSSSVPMGRIVFLPTLPATLAPAPDVRAGSIVSPGQSLLVGASDAPQFSFRVLPEAISRTTPGLQVEISVGDKKWSAEVDHLETAADDTGATIAVLRPVEGADSICGQECSEFLALGTKSVLSGNLILVPPTSGSEVPTSAIATDAAGNSFLTRSDGKPLPVNVLVSNNGRSIVEGANVGERILVTVPNPKG